MIDEIAVYRIAGVAFLAGSPVALGYIILPARTVTRKRIRWISTAFLGVGTCFIGWAASWPGPTSLTLAMMLGGLVAFLASAFCLSRSLLSTRKIKLPYYPAPPWIGWFPLLILPLSVIAIADRLPAWAFMWALAFAIYAGFKWLSWRRARHAVRAASWRSAAYLLAWPGMDAESFLDPDARVAPPRPSAWLGAIFQTTLGVALLWFVARSIPARLPLARGWLGMLGAVLVLHFGTFRIVALFWQRLGVDAVPIMSAPLRSRSLSEFWGKRWNLGFRQLAHDLIVVPMHRRLGVGTTGFLVFLVSGLMHDLVISLPARGGFGLPTLYFVVQGVGVAMERSSFGKWFGLRDGMRGWIFMAVFTAGPAFWLFHSAFIFRVILPFMEAIRAL